MSPHLETREEKPAQHPQRQGQQGTGRQQAGKGGGMALEGQRGEQVDGGCPREEFGKWGVWFL